MNLFKKYPRVVAIVALFVIATTGLRLVRTLTRPPETDVIRAYYDEVADQARTASMYLEKNAKVVVLTFDAEARSANNEPLRRMIGGLKEAGLSVGHVERLVMDTNQGWSDVIPGFPYHEFLRVARDHPDVDAIISLSGAPYLSPDTERPDPATLPPLLIARRIEWTQNLSKLLDEGRVVMAIVHGKTPSENGQDHEVEVLTAAGWVARGP